MGMIVTQCGKPNLTKRVKGANRRIPGLVLGLFLGSLSTSLCAVEAANVSPSNLTGQELPRPGDAVDTPGSETAQPQLPASVSGSVLDQTGAAVSNVRVALIAPGDTAPRTATTDSKGMFTFTGLPPGTYQLRVYAAGIESLTPEKVVLTTGEKQNLSVLVTRIPTKNTTVNVNATVNDIAREQVHEEEQQRIFGFLPNFYTSYIWKAAPMPPKLKFQLALRTAVDPVTFFVVAGVAGAEQAHNTFPGYGQGAEGYAKRYGASYADTVAGRMFGSAIFPAVLHQDPRYFYRGSGSVRSRVVYAVLQTVVCRGDNGKLEPNYSHVLGSFTAAGFSNFYRSPQDRRVGLTLRNGLIITAGSAVVNLMREFLSRKLTPNVPAFANGKP
jgi:hypothetical protein